MTSLFLRLFGSVSRYFRLLRYEWKRRKEKRRELAYEAAHGTLWESSREEIYKFFSKAEAERLIRLNLLTHADFLLTRMESAFSLWQDKLLSNPHPPK